MAVRHSRIPVRHSAARRRAEARRRARTRPNPLGGYGWEPLGIKIPVLQSKKEKYIHDKSKSDGKWLDYKQCREKRKAKQKEYYHPESSSHEYASSSSKKCKSQYNKYKSLLAKTVGSAEAYGVKIDKKDWEDIDLHEDSEASTLPYDRGDFTPASDAEKRFARYRAAQVLVSFEKRRGNEANADSFEEQEEEEFLLTDDADDAIDKKKGKKKNGKKKYVALAVAGLAAVGGIYWFSSKSG